MSRHNRSEENAQSSVALTIPQQAFDWYDEYAHGDIDRRTFMQRLATLGLAGLTLNAVAGALLPNYALAEQVSFNDPDIKASYLEFDAPQGHGKGRGYLVVPSGVSADKPAAGVLVAHENRGLNPYIEDVARRLAKVGYVAFAPDALYPLGGYPGNDDEGRAMQSTLERGKIEGDFVGAARMLKAHELTTDRLGMVGFCFGGYLTNQLAALLGGDIAAAVPYYGTPPQSDIGNIKAALQLHFAGLDTRVNGTWPDYEAALKAAQVEYTAFVYPDVNHGFHNDSTARYDEASAELAWQRTLEFFAQQLA
ncbi:dienelactone hydrolase family protein [Marinobacterium sp. D7]|uniref:dienelactone hydrolase family protein n=1 Tax=Marinobacterium ramblicola TaxID=2849041 RepID=UPI001C2D7736|nr:dienelactone hydrolase family protein [Marinobacterium ramblicola]MBV1790476.1 dienelactone hydrolase family protein [Marinobacterium ramblicola]